MAWRGRSAEYDLLLAKTLTKCLGMGFGFLERDLDRCATAST